LVPHLQVHFFEQLLMVYLKHNIFWPCQYLLSFFRVKAIKSEEHMGTANLFISFNLLDLGSLLEAFQILIFRIFYELVDVRVDRIHISIKLLIVLLLNSSTQWFIISEHERFFQLIVPTTCTPSKNCTKWLILWSVDVAIGFIFFLFRTGHKCFFVILTNKQLVSKWFSILFFFLFNALFIKETVRFFCQYVNQ
jgi:hypothetical protein